MTRAHSFSVAAALVFGLALCIALSLVACSLSPTTRARPQASIRVSAAPADHRIAQLDFAREARYALCTEPACPMVTRKTLSVIAPATAPEQPTVASPLTPPTAELKLSIAAESAVPPHKLVLRFATDSAALTVAHKSLLRGAIVELRQADRIVIVGRTDDLGSEVRNQSLAFARALAIRDHLLDLAPDLPARIAIDAKGRCCYAAPNDTSDGRAQNRRVELVFTRPGGRHQ